MYLPDLIQDVVDKKLRETFVGKTVTFDDINYGKTTIICKDAIFETDDGDCWIKFTSVNDSIYISDGQGIDIWFEVI